jgi:hypothetical protein
MPYITILILIIIMLLFFTIPNTGIIGIAREDMLYGIPYINHATPAGLSYTDGYPELMDDAPVNHIIDSKPEVPIRSQLMKPRTKTRICNMYDEVVGINDYVYKNEKCDIPLYPYRTW